MQHSTPSTATEISTCYGSTRVDGGGLDRWGDYVDTVARRKNNAAMTYPALRHVLQQEIKFVTAELQRLQTMLNSLVGETAAAAGPSIKRRGRPAKPKTDLPTVLALIRNAKKINAVSLGHLLRRQGLAKIPTAQLVEAGVKVAGTKGGTTYSYAG